MLNLLYTKKGNKFFFLDFSPSHNQLLLRSKKTRDRDYNIDILFKGVSNLGLSTSFDGIQILESPLKEDQSIQLLQNFKISDDTRLYILVDDRGEKKFINSLSFGVYHNNLDILSTSIGRYDYDDLGENVFWYPNKGNKV